MLSRLCLKARLTAFAGCTRIREVRAQPFHDQHHGAIDADRAEMMSSALCLVVSWENLLSIPSCLEATGGRDHMIRKASAIWRGTGRDGSGNLSTDSLVLARTPYSYRTRFESEKGTNPEELIAAAHAGCFTMSLAFALQMAGFQPTELVTEAAVSLVPDGPQGFKIGRSALTLRAQIPGITEEKFASIAQDAERTCPVSKVLKAEITLDAKLG